MSSKNVMCYVRHTSAEGHATFYMREYNFGEFVPSLFVVRFNSTCFDVKFISIDFSEMWRVMQLGELQMTCIAVIEHAPKKTFNLGP